MVAPTPRGFGSSTARILNKVDLASLRNADPGDVSEQEVVGGKIF